MRLRWLMWGIMTSAHCILGSKSLTISLKIISFKAVFLPRLEDKLCQVTLLLFTLPCISNATFRPCPHYGASVTVLSMAGNIKINLSRLADATQCCKCNIFHVLSDIWISVCVGLFQHQSVLFTLSSLCMSCGHVQSDCFWHFANSAHFVLYFLSLFGKVA